MRERLEKFKQLEAVCKITAFQRSPLYVFAMAAVALVTHVFGLEYFGFWMFAVVAVFTLVVSEDTMPFIPCLIYLFFSISRINGAPADNDFGMISSLPFIINGVVLVLLGLSGFVFHIIYYKNYRDFTKPTMLTSGLVALSLGLVSNGIFSNSFEITDMAIGLSFALLYYVVYLLIFHTLKWDKALSMRYFAFIMFGLGMLIAAEMGVLYLTDGELSTTFAKNLVVLGWAKNNSVAFVLLMPIVFAFYLAYTEKLSIVYYLGALSMLVAVVFTFSRASLVVALPIFVAGTIFLCLYARNKLPVWIAAGLLLVFATVLVGAYRDRLIIMLNFYLEAGIGDSGRFLIWKEGLKCFLSAPIFGVGFMYRFGDMGSFYWFHNTVIHFIATGGLVGIGTYVFHRVQTAIMFIKKPTVARSFAGIALVALLANSMLDVAMSIQYMLVIYSVMLAFCEHDALAARTE